jgi:lipopolysaccharide transport system ATP-binding protein
MPDIAVRVTGLAKQYRVGARSGAPYRTLRDALTRLATRPFRRRPPLAANSFWALDDVSFEVPRGEALGIIGRNGAGKSTLLKILSRVTEPTRGEADIHGRVGSLLEVGTGFHAELTGRENVYLNGAILGMKRAEISRKFADIVAFAEVEAFIDTPVKHYSSGMYTRLAFAVAACLEPEILIVDEVLAVGDARFQQRCLGRMGEVVGQGRTVLIVSHNMHLVTTFCSRCLVLDRGRLVHDGTAAEGVSRYVELSRESQPAIQARRRGSGTWRFTRVAMSKAVLEPAEPLECEFALAPAHPEAGAAYLSAHLVNELGAVIAQCDSRLVGYWMNGPGPVQGRFRVDDLWLKPGRYSIDFFVCTSGEIVDAYERACEFEVSPVLPYPCAASPSATANGLVLARFRWDA